MFFASDNNKPSQSADLSVDPIQPIEAIEEFGEDDGSIMPQPANKSNRENDQINFVSSTSSMIKLDGEASEGESLD